METSGDELIITPSLRLSVSELEFQYVRSSGPGGQNVNKVNSQAQMRWDVTANISLPEELKQRLQSLQRRRFTTEGVFFLSSQRFRDQFKNRQDCLDKLTTMLQAAAVRPRARKKTKISKGAKEARLRAKRQRSQRKESRRSPQGDE